MTGRKVIPLMRSIESSAASSSDHQELWKSPSAYREYPDEVFPCHVNPSSADKDDEMFRVVKEICPGLLEESSAKPQFEPLLGGLSNELFVWKRREGSILLRVHPSCTGGGLVDRETENKILAMLSRQGEAPTFFGRFENGRVEEFYNDHVPLSSQEMKNYPVEIGRILAGLHSKDVPENVLKPSEHGQIWNRIDDWIENARKLLASSDSDTARVSESESMISLFNALEEEWKWLQPQLRAPLESSANSVAREARKFANEVVLTHMDCQSLNLLRPVGSKGPLKIIDFEYAGLNPRAVDIANTFSEHMDMNNLKGDWEKEYPSEATQNVFLKSYLAHLRPAISPPDDLFLACLRQEIGRYTLLPHLAWAVWSIVNDRISDIDFDYVKYARHRLNGYRYFKQKFFNL